jgi:hypothetical protein
MDGLPTVQRARRLNLSDAGSESDRRSSVLPLACRIIFGCDGVQLSQTSAADHRLPGSEHPLDVLRLLATERAHEWDRVGTSNREIYSAEARGRRSARLDEPDLHDVSHRCRTGQPMRIYIGLPIRRNLAIDLYPRLIKSRMDRNGRAHAFRHRGARENTLLAINLIDGTGKKGKPDPIRPHLCDYEAAPCPQFVRSAVPRGRASRYRSTAPLSRNELISCGLKSCT